MSTNAETLPRVRKAAKHKPFRLSKNVKPILSALPSAWKITKKSARLLWTYKRLYIGIALVYIVLNLVFVRGLSQGIDVQELSNTLKESFSGNVDRLLGSISIISFIAQGNSEANIEVANIYNMLVLVVTSLAIIWALRRSRQQEVVTTKQAFYSGMTPLVPFILTIGLLLCMLIPLAIGNTIYGVVIQNAIATTTVERILWLMFFGLTILLSMYLITSAIFSLYIVTMPNMSPLLAIKSSRNIARFRRFAIMRKLMFLPFVMSLAFVFILVPVIIFVPWLAEPVYYLLVAGSIVFSHTYTYTLYRELL